MKACSRSLAILLALFLGAPVYSQISSAKVTYERKTNLHKKFKDWGDVKEWISADNKTKVDFFELYFSDSLSCFKPKESDIRERMDWATSQNTVYQDFSKKRRLSIKKIWGETVTVEDTLFLRQWKITSSKRNICGYSCRKAIWEINDSTRIYAWYANDLMVSTGPESFNGLPGVILGLATEDGGVIYFAKSVELIKPAPEVLVPEKKKKVYTTAELRTKFEKDFGKEKWVKPFLHETFEVW